MKVLIIEDEELAVQKLLRLLNGIVSDISVLGIIPSVEKAVNLIPQHREEIDLIFMDIQLDDGICFEIFEKISVDKPIIFTTAYDKFALEAFKQNSVDYLLKPINKEELKQAVDKYEKVHQKVSVTNIQEILKVLQLNQYKERFLIKVGAQYTSIDINNIGCFYIQEKCSFLCTDNGRNYGLENSLDQVENMIDPQNFIRISRNYIVRFSAIQEILVYSSSRLKLKIEGHKETDDILVSRERVKEFKKWMDR